MGCVCGNRGTRINLVGERYLLGVAARYSLRDLELMDELDARVRDGRLGGGSLDVFDMSQIPTMEDFEKYIPGIAPVSQSPVLGVWRDGVLVERMQGYVARSRLLSVKTELAP